MNYSNPRFNLNLGFTKSEGYFFVISALQCILYLVILYIKYDSLCKSRENYLSKQRQDKDNITLKRLRL